MIDIQCILDEQGLTAYGASQVIGAETDEALKTVSATLNRWRKGSPPRLAVVENYLRILGYEIRVEKVSPSRGN